MKRLFLSIFLILIFYNFSYASSLSDIKNLLNKNKPPVELFGIKLFEDINKYSKDEIKEFTYLEIPYEDLINDKTELLGREVRWVLLDNVEIKNSNFEYYNVYVNKKLEIVGIEGYTHIQGIDQPQICFDKKTKLLELIAELHVLNIENFKEEIYVSKDGDKGGAIRSVFEFNHDGIDLNYSVSCIFNEEDKKMWANIFIELSIEELDNDIYKLFYKKSKKSTEQLGFTYFKNDAKGL